ncbi:MAG: hypothetical protein J6X11_03595 [Treponema sp.]|nr:hypothetical protein [Treponema sp.]
MNYIIDEEIDLEEKDYLNSKQYSKALKDIIDSAPKNKVFTIGLFGGWGTGKSSIIKTTEKLYKDNKAVKFVKYDAWQYVNDSFRRTFLITLCNQLKINKEDYLNSFYNNETKDIKFEHKLSPFAIVCLTLGILLSIFVLPFNPIDQGIKITSVMVFTLLSTIFTIITKLTDTYKTSITEQRLFAPEQFSECFNKIISAYLKKQSQKLIVVIDNMDRCQGDSVYSLFTDIKTFLGNENKNLIFLIPVDDVELKKQIFDKTKTDNDNKENEEFLRKSFNTVLRIKPFVETDMYVFAKKIVEQNNLEFNDDVIYLASKKYSKNPRRIVKLYNNLLSEFSFYEDKGFVEKNQAMICICLIIREEYFDFYKLLINSPSFLKDQTLIDKKNKNIIASVEGFLLISKTVIQKFDVNVIEKIINNNDSYYAGISDEIKDSIDNFNFEKFLLLLENNIKNKDDILSYLINNKVISAIRNRNKNEICNLFNFIAEINNKIKEELYAYLQNIDGQFIQYEYKNIIEDTTNKDVVCKFIEYLAEKHFDAAKTDLIAIVSNFNIEERNIDKDLFESTLKYCNDIEASKQLSLTFELVYGESGSPTALNQNQFDYLVTEGFIDKRIQKITNNKVMDNNLLLLCTIFENKRNYTQDNLDKFLKSLTKTMTTPTNKTFETLHEEIVFVVQIFMSFIKNYTTYKKAYSNNNHLQKIHNYFFNQRNVNGSLKVYLNEVINNEPYLDDSISLLQIIYVLSKETYPMQKEYTQLKAQKPVKLLGAYYELMDKYEMSLLGIANMVLEAINSLDSQENLMLYKHLCFLVDDNNNGYAVQINNITSKFVYLFDFTSLKEEKQKLIIELCDDVYYSEKITDSLIAKGDEFINNLPPEILSRVKKVFNENTKDKYKNNYILLSIIAAKGSKEQKRIIKNIIIENIHNHIEVKESVNLIESGSFEQSIRNEFKTTLHSYLEEGTEIEEDLKERIANILYK